jgi:hypothetical protein
MKTISINELTEIVRTNLDELNLNESMMVDGDELELDQLISNVAGVCADEIHTAAPSQLLDGVDVYLDYESVKKDEKDGKVLVLYPQDIVRLVAFRAKDSDVTISMVVAEDSPKGRMQKDKYVRGTYDDPVLVAVQGATGINTELKYYTLKETAADPVSCVDVFKVIYRQIGGAGHVEVSDYVVSNYYDYVTARVLSILGETTKAQEFSARASFAK